MDAESMDAESMDAESMDAESMDAFHCILICFNYCFVFYCGK